MKERKQWEKRGYIPEDKTLKRLLARSCPGDPQQRNVPSKERKGLRQKPLGKKIRSEPQGFVQRGTCPA